MTFAEGRVREGAKFLDEKIPDWYRQVVVEELDMADECRCVLGQLGDKQVNLDRVGWHPDSWDPGDGFSRLTDAFDVAGGQIGCDVVWDSKIERLMCTFEELRDAWVVEIETRLTTNAVA